MKDLATLEGKKILMTGGAGNIGRASALLLAEKELPSQLVISISQEHKKQSR